MIKINKRFYYPTSTRKIIDGKPMYFLTRTKRWIPDKKPPETTKALLSSTNNAGEGTKTPITSNVQNIDKEQDKQLLTANAHLSIKNSLLALAAQFE